MMITKPGTVVGDFELLARLAVGGMGEVWKALRRSDGVLVALKLLYAGAEDDPAEQASLQDELRVAEGLRHPGIVRVYGGHEVGGRRMLSMEFVDGQDLRRVVAVSQRAGGRVPVGVAVALIADVADALAYAHAHTVAGVARHIVHRDVSPQNIMLTVEGRARLLDFGIALFAQREAHTRTGVVKGKLGYLSPEQALAVRLGPESDQFSLGVVLWELLAQRRLFAGPGPESEVLRRIVHAEVPDLTQLDGHVSPALWQVVRRMLSQHPRDRFPDMSEVAARLRSAEAALVGASAQALVRSWWARLSAETASGGTRRLPAVTGTGSTERLTAAGDGTGASDTISGPASGG